MRTTLTIDDDLAGLLQKKAAQQGHSFKEVVNDTLRAGLASNSVGTQERKRFRVMARALGLRPGIDPDRMNQLVDEEVENHPRKAAEHDSAGH